MEEKLGNDVGILGNKVELEMKEISLEKRYTHKPVFPLMGSMAGAPYTSGLCLLIFHVIF